MEEQPMNTGDIWGFNVNPSERLQFCFPCDNTGTGAKSESSFKQRSQKLLSKAPLTSWDSVPKRRGSPTTRPLSQYASYGPDAISIKETSPEIGCLISSGFVWEIYKQPQPMFWMFFSSNCCVSYQCSHQPILAGKQWDSSGGRELENIPNGQVLHILKISIYLKVSKGIFQQVDLYTAALILDTLQTKNSR